MKKILAALTLIVPVAGIISCSDKSSPLPDISENHVYQGSELKLYYCGELMPGKKITFLPGKEDASPALLCEGTTDLSQLSSIGLHGSGPAPGILPGSPEVTLPLNPEIGPGYYRFEGAGATTFVDYSYSGFLYKDTLALNIKEVKLLNSKLAGSIWKPAQYSQSGAEIESLPFHLVWEIDPSSEIDFDLSTLLKVIVTLPVVPTYHGTAYSSITQLLESSLQTIAFNRNGNIFVRYYSSVGGATQLVTSVGNTLQYIVTDGSNIKLFPNPTSLFGLWLVAQSDSEGIPNISFSKSQDEESQKDKETAEGILTEFLKGVIPVFLSMTEEGIPMEFVMTEDYLEIYLNTPTILSLLGNLVKSVSDNPELITKILNYIGADPDWSELFPYIQKLLPEIENILNKTTRIEIGLSLKKYEG